MHGGNNNLYLSNGLYAANNSNLGPQIKNDFARDLLSQVVKTHIKLYPDNP